MLSTHELPPSAEIRSMRVVKWGTVGVCFHSKLFFSLALVAVFNSEVFGDGTKKVTVGGVEIKTLGIFKKGISPIWEDKANVDGFQLEATRTYNTECMDVQWENLVLGLIGEAVDDEDQICGARLVNQVKKGSKAHCYKIEVWLKKKDEEVANKVKARLGEVLCDVDKSRPHLRMPADEFVLERRSGRH